jgi:hypothetical protein
MLCRVVWYKFNDVSKVLAVSIIRAIQAAIRAFALIMEAATTSETSVNFYQITRRIPEGSKFLQELY